MFLALGDSGVGKTSLLVRYVDDSFELGNATIFADVKHKKFDLGGGVTVNLELWDTAGFERHAQSLPQNLFRGCDGVVIVYDVTNLKSFRRVPVWRNLLKEKDIPDYVPVILIGNKSDLNVVREVEYTEGLEFAANHGMTFTEAFARLNTMVASAFQMLVMEAMKNSVLGNNMRPRSQESINMYISHSMPPQMHHNFMPHVRVNAYNYQQNRQRMPPCNMWLNGGCPNTAFNCPRLHTKDHMPLCKFWTKGRCYQENACIKRHYYLECDQGQSKNQPEQSQGEEDTPMTFSSPFRQKIVVETKELRRVEVDLDNGLEKSYIETLKEEIVDLTGKNTPG